VVCKLCKYVCLLREDLFVFEVTKFVGRRKRVTPRTGIPSSTNFLSTLPTPPSALTLRPDISQNTSLYPRRENGKTTWDLGRRRTLKS
jgi:hypothetical protein